MPPGRSKPRASCSRNCTWRGYFPVPNSTNALPWCWRLSPIELLRAQEKFVKRRLKVSREFRLFLFIEHHISRGNAPAATVGDVDVPIAAAIIISGRVAESAGDAVNVERKALEFEECSGGSLIKLDSETWKTAETEGGPEFVIAKARAKAQRSEDFVPVFPGTCDNQFPLELFLVAAVARGAEDSRGLGGKDRASDWGGAVLRSRRLGAGPWSRRFNANSKKSATATKIGVRSVVEGVPFEDTAFVERAEILELTEQGRNIRDAELYLDLAVRPFMWRHGAEYTLAACPGNEVARADARQHNRIPTVFITPNSCVDCRKLSRTQLRRKNHREND